MGPEGSTLFSLSLAQVSLIKQPTTKKRYPYSSMVPSGYQDSKWSAVGISAVRGCITKLRTLTGFWRAIL